MKRLLLILLLPLLVSAQEHQTENQMVVPVGRGMDTRSSDLDIKPGFARRAHNVDFSRNQNAISPRYGFTKTSALGSGYDSLLGLYGVYYSDATKRLAFAADSAGAGWGGVYVTDTAMGRIDTLTTRIVQYWNTQYPTTFSMFDDKLYAVNGVQKGIVWDGKNARSFPLAAPGEPKIVPIGPDTGAYRLNGEYRYIVSMTSYDGGTGTAAWSGYVSAPIKVTNGRVLMTDFVLPQNDSVRTAVDSAHIYIYRTKANPGRWDNYDSAYARRSGWDFTIWGDSAKNHGSGADTTHTPLGAFTFIDSIADSLIPASPGKVRIDDNYRGHDSVGAMAIRYGAPSYDANTSLYYNGTVTDTATEYKHGGIYHGLPVLQRQKSLGVLYAATFFDTLNHMESDTGRSLFVAARDSSWGSDTTIYSVRMSLPNIPDSVVGVVRNVYKAYVIPIGGDTSILVRKSDLPCQMYGDPYRNTVKNWNDKAGWDAFYSGCYGASSTSEGKWGVYLRSLTGDTVMTTPFFFVGQIPADSSAFTDSTRYDSLLTHAVYRGKTPPHLLNNIFAYGGRMWGTQGSNLYWSKVDSAQYWGAFDFVAVNPDDGDVITAAWPKRRAIAVKKNNSGYNVYQDGNGEWNLTEVTGGIGCVAAKSHIRGIAGDYYLSREGMILETEGQYLERTANAGLISARLNNFEKLPITTLNRAYGAYLDGRCLWTIGDTTYVYDEKADTWSTWNLKLGGATMYGAGSNVKFLPGDSLYFYYPNGKSVYVYGGVDYDSLAASDIAVDWLSGPLLASSNLKILNSVGMWTSGDDTTTIPGYVYNENDSSLSGNITFSTKATNHFERHSILKSIPSLFYQLRIHETNSSDTWSVNGFELWFSNIGNVEIK